MARPRSEDYQQKQRHILDSAAAVFAEQGIDQASMSQIAKQANVSKTLLYHYYEGKSALLFDIIFQHLVSLENALHQVDVNGLQAHLALRKLIHQLLNEYQNADNCHKVQITCMNALTSDQRNAIREIERRIVKQFADVLVRINPALSGDKLKPVTLSLFGSLNWTYLWFSDEGPVSRSEYADIIATTTLEGIVGIR